MDGRSQRRRLRRALAATATACLLLAASGAAAEPPTRGHYVEQLEAVCKPDALATQRAMKGVRADVRKERLRAAARKFARASRIFGATVKEIAAMPRPGGDTARLRKWFRYLKRQQAYLRRISAQLRRGRAIKAQRLTARFIQSGKHANNVVLAFGFNYCSFKFSRYG